MCLAILGCATPETEPPEAETLRVAVLPDQDRETLLELYEPLVEYLAAATGYEIELLIPADYDEELDWFDDDRIQLAWFGGLTFLRAERRSAADALVMRDVDLRFTTDFLVAGSRTETSLREFESETLAFGPALSTSGHLMPRHYLDSQGIDPETLFSGVLHSRGHDQTALWVQEGRVEVGAVNSVVAEEMFREGRLSPDLVRVLETTPPYRNYVWAVRPDLSTATRTALLDAFLALQPAVPEHEALLRAQGARGYVPATGSDFDDLRGAAENMGLLDGGDS